MRTRNRERRRIRQKRLNARQSPFCAPQLAREYWFYSRIVAALTYLDRVSISAAAVPIMREFGLSSVGMGYVFSVFALAYALFELPMGWLADRVGARTTLSRIVICWSAFTLLTGVAWNFGTLVATRFLFGAAEAGAFPTAARALSEWFPVSSRGRVTGILWSGARIGGCVAPLISTLLIVFVGWRWMFAILGAVGGVVGVLFWRLYRDRADRPTVAQEGDRPQGIWRRILMNRSVWALFWMYFASSYGFWFFLTWLPTYLIREHTVTARAAGFYAVLPLAMGSLTCLIGGTLADSADSKDWKRPVVANDCRLRWFFVNGLRVWCRNHGGWNSSGNDLPDVCGRGARSCGSRGLGGMRRCRRPAFRYGECLYEYGGKHFGVSLADCRRMAV